MIKHILLGVVFTAFSVCVNTSLAQSLPQYPDTWSGVWVSMTMTSLPQDPESRDLVEKIRSRVDALHEIWKGHHDEIDDDYLMEMTLEAYLLKEALGSMPNDKAKEVLKEIALDTEIKLNHCLQHPNGMGSRVNLTVTTVSPSGDSEKWQVFYVSAGLKKYLGEPGKPLRIMSNPAKGSVNVGNNLIWAEKGNITTKEKSYPIGFGKDDLKIEIPVP